MWTGGAGDFERGGGTAGTAARHGHSRQNGIKPDFCSGQRGRSRCARRAMLRSNSAISLVFVAKLVFISFVGPVCFGVRQRAAAFERCLNVAYSKHCTGSTGKLANLQGLRHPIPWSQRAGPFCWLHDHGEPKARFELDIKKACGVLEEMPEPGISMDDMTRQLVDEGVEKFNKPFDKLMETFAQRSPRHLTRNL
jgi:hypothetical protein